MKSNTHKTADGQEHDTDDNFSLKDSYILIDTERNARAAREHFGIHAVEFDSFFEEFETLDNVSLIVVSAFNAYGLSKMLIERYGPGVNVRFVDLEGKTLEIMAKRPTSRFRFWRLIENPWHVTMTSGRC